MHLNPPHSGFFCAQPSVTHGMVYHPMSNAMTSQKNNRPERFEAIRPAIRISSHVRGSLIQPLGFKSTCSLEVHRLCLPSGYVISLQLPYRGFEVGTAGSLHGHIDRYGGRHFLDGCGGRGSTRPIRGAPDERVAFATLCPGSAKSGPFSARAE